MDFTDNIYAYIPTGRTLIRRKENELSFNCVNLPHFPRVSLI